MSEKQKYLATLALPVALRLRLRLTPLCERIAIAGSLRREKPTVGDIELLYAPRLESRPVDMFTTQLYDIADDEIQIMLTDKTLVQRPNSRGHLTWGPKNKYARHVASGIPVDLFATTVENWWVALVIRTGSLEMNLKLTSGALKLGRTLNAYGSGVTVLATGEVIPATSEAHVFELCGVPYREPGDRNFL